jgi:hypothetical protein
MKKKLEKLKTYEDSLIWLAATLSLREKDKCGG